MENFEISKMCLSDIQKICELESLCFSSPWSEKALKDELENENALFIVCKMNGELAGYIGSICVLDECSITNVAVFPEFRRKSIGKELVTQLCAFAKERGAQSVYLEVRKSNAAARALYEKCGFTLCGERKNFYTAPTENAYIMNITL